MRIQWKEKNHTHTHLHPQTTLENAYPRYRKLKTLLPVPCSKTPRKSTSRSTSDNASYKQSSQSIVVVVIDRTSLFKTNVRRKNKSYLQNRFEKMESSVLISTRHKQTTEKLKLKPTTASRQFAPVYFPLLLLQSTFHLHQPTPHLHVVILMWYTIIEDGYLVFGIAKKNRVLDKFCCNCVRTTTTNTPARYNIYALSVPWLNGVR